MTAADPRLREHRDVWDRKPGLRAVYADYHIRLLDAVPNGPILEIGGGSGNFRDIAPNAISVDLAASPWVDVCCDAHELPFLDGAFSGIVMLDVLHHLARPAAFFAEAARALRPGGRLAARGLIQLIHAPFKVRHGHVEERRLARRLIKLAQAERVDDQCGLERRGHQGGGGEPERSCGAHAAVLPMRGDDGSQKRVSE